MSNAQTIAQKKISTSTDVQFKVLRMAHLETALLSLMMAFGHPGQSPYSMTKVAECGASKTQPTCHTKSVCNAQGSDCAPVHWSASRKAWVRKERTEEAEQRFRKIAKILSKQAKQVTKCALKDPQCTRGQWRGSSEDFALATLTVILHESGLREDIEFGVSALGRGKRGGLCLMQIQPTTAAKYASWLSASEQKRVKKNARADDLLAKTMLGDAPSSLEHCLSVGMQLLVNARQSCERSRHGWSYGMFSMYASGSSCSVSSVGPTRQKTFRQLQHKLRQITTTSR
jgi:hypothetical protein